MTASVSLGLVTGVDGVLMRYVEEHAVHLGDDVGKVLVVNRHPDHPL